MDVKTAAAAPLPPVRSLCTLLLLCLAALLGALHWHTLAQDRLARAHADHLAATAVRQFAREAEVLVRDYGYWDEAYRNLVEAPDPQWVAGNVIVEDLQDLLGIDAFLVLDTENRPVFAETAGPMSDVGRSKRTEVPQLLAGGLNELIAHVRGQDVGRPVVASAFVNLGGALALVAVSPVLPYPHEEKVSVRGDKVHLLVFVRPLTEARIAMMSQDFDLPGLKLAAKTGSSQPSLSLTSQDGGVVGALTWLAEHPGRQPHALLIGMSAVLAAALGWLVYRTGTAWSHYQRAQNAAQRREAIAAQATANFIEHVSQDLRRPLSAITGVTQLVKSEFVTSLENSRYTAYLTDIASAARHMVETLSTVVDAAAFKKRPHEFQVEPVTLSSVLGDVEKMLAFRFKRRDVGLRIVHCPEHLRVSANPMALKQIVLELIANALKETETDGMVSVEVSEADGNWIELRVADQGDGLSQERISVLLHPFAALAPDSARDADLGFAVIQALVHLHGGSMKILSQPGEGTVVELRLPRA